VPAYETHSVRNKGKSNVTYAPLLAAVLATSLALPVNAAPFPAPKNAPLVQLASSKAKHTKGLAGTAWILDSLQGQPAPSDKSLDLSFSEGNAAGTDGCNRLAGGFKENADRTIVIGPFASTMMACLDPNAGKFAKSYVDALQKVASYSVRGGSLHLLAADGSDIAIYRKQANTLDKTVWAVTGYNNGHGGVESNEFTPKMSLTFSAHGKLVGEAGCGVFKGKYRFDKTTGSITIKMKSQVPSCEENVPAAPAQDAMMQALNNSMRYARMGKTLELRSVDGAAQLVLTAQ
jgi:heat shock protein HslJ